MKKLLLLIVLVLSVACSKENKSIHVMSFNIRYNNPGDGENAWIHRKDIAASMIRFHGADIAGLQEALKGQIDDLTELLPEYGWYGVGRDDGVEAGEFMVILYRRNRFELLDKATFWLSQTPDSVSMGWDAACYRTVTWCKFKDMATGKVFFHFNTHFDHRGRQARIESARLLVEKVKEIAGDYPVVITGDFNTGSTSEPYGILTGAENINENEFFKDARLISEQGHHGPTGTSTGFTSIRPGRQIDYIFIKNRVQVLKHGFLSDTFDGRFPSDHLPVLAEVIIDGKSPAAEDKRQTPE